MSADSSSLVERARAFALNGGLDLDDDELRVTLEQRFGLAGVDLIELLDEAADRRRDTPVLEVPSASLNALERTVWYADRLRDRGMPSAEIAAIHPDDLDKAYRGEPLPQRDKHTGVIVTKARAAPVVHERTETTTHSWTPIDLFNAKREPPEPPTIGGVVYPGRRHVFSGEPESLKSWLVLVLCVEQLRAGRDVVYVDFEMGHRETRERLEALGVDEDLAHRFVYITPAEPLTSPDVLADMRSLIETRNPSLVIVDAFAGALALHGCDPNSGSDVERFYRTVADELRANGAAIVILDHLPKDKETRGRFAIGSERKIGGVDVHLRFEIAQPFGRGKTGRARVQTMKDRPGHLRRPKTADLELESAAGGAITWTLTIPDDQPATPFRPTALMEKVSIYVERCVEPPSRNQVEKGVTGNAKYKRDAIDVLLADGHLAADAGAHGATLLRSLKPYRQTDEPASSSTSSDLVPTSTTDEARSSSSTSSLPLQGEGRLDEDELEHLERLQEELGL